jgi:hypothetical protein
MSPDLLPDLFEAQKKLRPALKRRLACPDYSNVTALVGCEIGDHAKVYDLPRQLRHQNLGCEGSFNIASQYPIVSNQLSSKLGL